MAAVDPRTPVIVGAGQVTHRDAGAEPSPLELMARAVRLAAEDCARPALLGRAQTVAAVDVLSWPVADPARAVADGLGLAPGETVRTIRSGSGPVELLGALGSRIAAGQLDVALVVGGEAVNPFMRAVREGRDPGWPAQPDGTRPDRLIGTERNATHPTEREAGLIAPIAYYPLFESAVRHAAGRSPNAHREWLGRLWGRFAAVARENPHAWTRDAPGPEGIATASPANRMVAEPYTKLMTANIQVDQAAALLLCSVQAAERAGVPAERWTFLHATATAHDHWFAVERERLDRSPAIAACSRAALGHAGVGIDDIEHLDLYSCFPSAVQVAATELGLDLEADGRAVTVTGGLTFAGGPASNYVTHAVATLCGRLREGGGFGVATGVGWYLTKHGMVVLGDQPPRRPFRHSSVQDEVDRLPRRGPAPAAAGTAELEAFTALYDRAGEPTLAIASCRLADGGRALGRTEDRDGIQSLLSGDPVGAEVGLDGEGGFVGA